MARTGYQRLTRTLAQHGVVSSGRSSLWLGENHLLRIDSSGYTENYRRFFLRDIQAVIIRKTLGMQIRVLVHGVFALFWVLCALSASEPIWLGVWWSLTGLSLIFLTINLILGPCCAFHIKTAVQNEAIPSIHRLRKARQILDRLRPLLAAAQGQLSPEEIQARYQRTAQGGSAETIAAAFPLTADIPNPTAGTDAPESGPSSAGTSG
jgi:hypothetical protein